jgi:peptidoglycan/LPS O-acetylase OafA/YrhL
MPSVSKRVLQLDVLRAIAILLVIGRHLELPRPGGPVGFLANAWFRIGWLGVDLFFVLSGFLIGGLLISEFRKHRTIDVPRFLIRRGLKIYPPYFVFIAYLIGVPTIRALAAGEAGDVLASGWAQYWPNLLFLQNYVGANPAGHTWSLAVEEHFYLLLPLPLLWLLTRGRTRDLHFACLAAVPLALLGLRALSVFREDEFAIRMAATHLRLDALLFGVGVRITAEYSRHRFDALGRWRRSLVIVGVLLWLPVAVIDPSTAFVRTFGLTMTFLGAAAFLIAACHTHASHFRVTGRLASAAALALGWVGVYSYAIYLWHVTAMGILERLIGRPVLAATGGTTQVGWMVAAGLVTFGAIAVGIGASHLVEWPVLRLRDRFFPSRIGTVPLTPALAGASSQPHLNNRGTASAAV